jgi:hypothetical protein
VVGSEPRRFERRIERQVHRGHIRSLSSMPCGD